jgi:polyhydroxybutyrate depolymerase
MKKTAYLMSITLLVFLGICDRNTMPSQSPPINYGKNHFTTTIDGDKREYFVHVPRAYTGKGKVPMVLMLHGTSGNGEKFYNVSGWKEVGDVENIITVFPSSWRYCIITQGQVKRTTKWNTPPDAEWTFCNGQQGRDDIKFLNTVIDEVSSKYMIDEARIYLAGFSNGGQMAAKCAIEMSDRLAAVVSSASAFYKDTIYVPKRKVPTVYQVGDRDYGPGNTGPAVPLDTLGYLISTPNIAFKRGSFHRIANNYVRNFSLDPSFTMQGDTSKFVYANYKPLASSDTHEFNFVLIKNLAHRYPNGKPLHAAKLNWKWMQQYRLH